MTVWIRPKRLLPVCEVMSDSTEKSIDWKIQRRLDGDDAYRNAATADEQAEREVEIVRQVEEEVRP